MHIANLNYATTGAGRLAHLATELLSRAGGFRMNHVPYRGVAAALTDVMRGDVTMIFAPLSTATVDPAARSILADLLLAGFAQVDVTKYDQLLMQVREAESAGYAVPV
jgi:hypothetical protein